MSDECLDNEWQGLDFLKLAESLWNRTDRNLKTLHNSGKHEKYKPEKIFQRRDESVKTVNQTIKQVFVKL